MRTIVFSDVHGEPDIVRAVLAHSQFNPEADRLVFAGDAIELGPDSMVCLDLLDESGAECLVGNHEFGAYCARPIEGEALTAEVSDRIVDVIASGRWRCATVIDGVLITHAGLGERMRRYLGLAGERDVGVLAQAINEEFARVVARASCSDRDIAGADGPIWWRPEEVDPPAVGIVQVAGHTPPEILEGAEAGDRWADRGLYLIDPFVRGWHLRIGTSLAPVRYAIVRDGVVDVINAREQEMANSADE